MEQKIEKKYIGFIILIYILTFQNFIQNIFPLFQYVDELVSLFSVIFVLQKMIKSRKNRVLVKKYDIYMTFFLLILFMAGTYSSLFYNYQPISIAMIDCLIVYKFFLTYLLSQLVFDSTFIKKNKRKINRHVKIIITTLFILTVSNYAFNIWPTYSYRFGLMTNQLFYGHPTYLAASCIFLLSLFVMTNYGCYNFFNAKVYYWMCIVTVLSTLRFKAIGAIVIIMIIVSYYRKQNRKISFSKLGLLAIVLVMVAWNQISYYYIDIDNSARKSLTEVSFKIANDYAPIGTGFGTFGSYYSVINYSSIYYKYGISGVYGLSIGRAAFVSDTFWPMIIGQFGYIGLISYLFAILCIFKKIQDEFSEKHKLIYFSKIISLIYLLISSTSESAFVNPIAVPLALIIGLKINDKEDDDNGG